MPEEDLLIVLLCELGERIVAMRELLAEPSLASKPHTRAVAALLTRGLDAVEERMARAGTSADGGLSETPRPTPAILAALHDCGRALRVLHRRLGLLDMRWSAAPVDIFLRKLRDDAGDLPHPAVVLSDDYDALHEDVAERLRAALAEAGVVIDDAAAAEPVIALPRLEVANPLAWPLLLPALARLHVQQGGAVALPANAATEHAVDRAVARLGGPAAFAARAAHELIAAPLDRPAWAALAPLARAGELEQWRRDDGKEQCEAGEAVALFTRLLHERDALLGHDFPATGHDPTASGHDPVANGESVRRDADGDPDPGVPQTPGVLLPTEAETAALLAKLVDGTPINAVDPPLPDDFVARLAAVRDAAGFYQVIAPLGEQPASLAAILHVGWLYKVQYSYPLFRDALRAAPLSTALAAYRPHMIERNDLLLQSIEAAYVQGIFIRGRLDP